MSTFGGGGFAKTCSIQSYCAFRVSGASQDMQAPFVKRAVEWLVSHQKSDGGWGEGLRSVPDEEVGVEVAVEGVS